MGRHPCFLPWESTLRLLSNSFQWKIRGRRGKKRGEQEDEEERRQTEDRHEEEEKKKEEEEEALEDLGLSQKHEQSLRHN